MKRRVIAYLMLMILVPVALLSIIVLNKLGILERPRSVLPAPAVESNPDYVRTIQRWKAAEFVAVTSSDQLQQLAQSVPLSGFRLQSGTATSLRTVLGDFFQAYHEGDSEAYLRFRLSPGAEPNDKPLLWQSRQLTSKHGFAESDLPSDAQGIHRLFFEAAYASRIGLGFIERFSPAQSRIEVETFSTQPEMLTQRLEQDDNAGIVSYRPTFDPKPSIDDLLASFGSVLIADCVFLVWTEAFADPCPLAVRLFWVPAESRWYPSELCVAYAGIRGIGFVF
jgi:hypothetical protein